MKTFFKYALVAIAATAFVCMGVSATIAIAQTITPTAPPTVTSDTGVVIPIGQWIHAIAGVVALLTVPAVGFLFRHLPGQWSGMLTQARVDVLLENAINYGINTVSEASQDKSLTGRKRGGAQFSSVCSQQRSQPGKSRWWC